MQRIAMIVLMALMLALPTATIAQPATPAASPIPTSGDFAGLVDIGGGRRLWLECRGQGSPTVLLEAGSGNSAEVWDAIALEPDSGETAVLPGVAAFTRVCAYDRPGTLLPPDRLGRSDPAPMLRTAADAVEDLHALIAAAGIPGPYVLVGHSMGGMIVRLYAATYPEEIAGMVLIDASHEAQNMRFEAALTAEQWAELAHLVLAEPDEYSNLEWLDRDASFAQLKAAIAAQPLQPLPLFILTPSAATHSLSPPDLRAAFPPDFPWDALEQVHQDLQNDLAALVPDARHIITNKSDHYIQVDQPTLVIEAIHQVVAGVRNPDTWYDLASCCAD